MEQRGIENRRGADRVSLPEVRLPAREARLRRELMALSRQSQTDRRRLKEAFIMRMRTKILVPLVAAVAVAGSIAVFAVFSSVATKPVAFATLHANPAFTMAINAQGEVVEVVAHDEAAERLLDAVDLAGIPLKDVIAKVAEALNKAGYLVPENNISVAVHPAERGKDVSELATTLEAELKNALGDKVSIVVVTLSAEDFKYLEDNGLLPGDYANIVADTGTIETIRKLVAMNEALVGADGELATDRFGTIVEALNEMVYVGISQTDALGLIERAIAAGFDLNNISELADNHEEFLNIGLSPVESKALVNAAIAAGLGTDDLWDMADLHLEFRERGMPFADAQAFIIGQVAAGWNADAVDSYADIFEARRAGEEDPYDAPAPAPAPAPVAPPTADEEDYDAPAPVAPPAADEEDYDAPAPVAPPAAGEE